VRLERYEKKKELMKITTEKNKNNLHEKSIHSTTYFQKGTDSIEIKKTPTLKLEMEQVYYLRFQRMYRW